MTNVRRLWYWSGACSISQLAMEGVKRPNDCKFTVAVDEVILTDVIEINLCTAAAEANIKAVNEWKN